MNCANDCIVPLVRDPASSGTFAALLLPAYKTVSTRTVDCPTGLMDVNGS